MSVVDAPAPALPRPYLVWLAGVTVGRCGDAVLAFALAWAAAGHGGTTAALVLTVGALPRLVLLVVGGAVADRVGARRLLVAGESTLLALTVALAVALTHVGTSTWLLVVASVALGTITAWCLPASGSMPRRLVPDEQLPRALALRQSAGQAVLVATAPLGGVLVAGVGLAAVAWGNAAALVVAVAALVLVRELPAPDDVAAPGAAPRLDVLDGVRVVARTPGLARALLLTAAAAALLIPVPSLLVPLTGRAAGWGAGATGVVAGAVGIGVIVATLHAARRRAPAALSEPSSDVPPEGSVRPAGAPPVGSPAVAPGLAVAAAGALVLAVGPAFGSPWVAGAGALVLGLGHGVVVARLAPAVLGSAPRTHLARVQALAGLAQVVPVMASTAALGTLAEQASPGWATGATAVGLVMCAAGAHRPRTRVPA